MEKRNREYYEKKGRAGYAAGRYIVARGAETSWQAKAYNYGYFAARDEWRAKNPGADELNAGATRIKLRTMPNQVKELHMRLVYSKDQREVKIGDVVKLRDGDAVVTGWRKPHHAGSTGRVYVKPKDSKFDAEYFPSVIGAEWIEREDRANFDEDVPQ